MIISIHDPYVQLSDNGLHDLRYTVRERESLTTQGKVTFFKDYLLMTLNHIPIFAKTYALCMLSRTPYFLHACYILWSFVCDLRVKTIRTFFIWDFPFGHPSVRDTLSNFLYIRLHTSLPL